jgi:hypothetical protein
LSQQVDGTGFEPHLAVDLSPVARQFGTRPSALWADPTAHRQSRRDDRALLELLALWQPPTLDARPSVPIINRNSTSSDAWRRPADPAAVDRLYALTQGHDPLGLLWFDEP